MFALRLFKKNILWSVMFLMAMNLVCCGGDNSADNSTTNPSGNNNEADDVPGAPVHAHPCDMITEAEVLEWLGHGVFETKRDEGTYGEPGCSWDSYEENLETGSYEYKSLDITISHNAYIQNVLGSGYDVDWLVESIGGTWEGSRPVPGEGESATHLYSFGMHLFYIVRGEYLLEILIDLGDNDIDAIAYDVLDKVVTKIESHLS